LSFNFRTHKIRKGFDQFPPVGAKVYVCSSGTIIEFLKRFGSKDTDSHTFFSFATLSTDSNTKITISPQALFGRHCAIVGTTGSGKSFTVAKLIEETKKNNGKAILIDATGEYGPLSADTKSVSTVTFNRDTFFHYTQL